MSEQLVEVQDVTANCKDWRSGSAPVADPGRLDDVGSVAWMGRLDDFFSRWDRGLEGEELGGYEVLLLGIFSSFERIGDLVNECFSGSSLINSYNLMLVSCVSCVG